MKFTHPLDSHYAVDQDEEEPDVGEFTKLPNGDDLETGVMAAPHLGGKIMPYEEVWRELDPRLDLAGSDGGDGSSSSSRKPGSWILESIDQPTASDDSVFTKSYYAKAGTFFLALRQVKDASASSLSFSAIRQEWEPDTLSWTTKYKIGNVDGMFDLAKEADGDRVWAVGDKVTVGFERELCIVRAIGL